MNAKRVPNSWSGSFTIKSDIEINRKQTEPIIRLSPHTLNGKVLLSNVFKVLPLMNKYTTAILFFRNS